MHDSDKENSVTKASDIVNRYVQECKKIEEEILQQYVGKWLEYKTTWGETRWGKILGAELYWSDWSPDGIEFSITMPDGVRKRPQSVWVTADNPIKIVKYHTPEPDDT